jgi:phosphoglycerate dehydrogenase-like enzyme
MLDGKTDRFASLADAEAVIAGSTQFTAEVQARAPRLRVISRTGIGIDSTGDTMRGRLMGTCPRGRELLYLL